MPTNMKVARVVGTAIGTYVAAIREAVYSFKVLVDKMATAGWTVSYQISDSGNGFSYASLPADFQTLIGGSGYSTYYTIGYFDIQFDNKRFLFIFSYYSSTGRHMWGIFTEPEFVKAGYTLPLISSIGGYSQIEYSPSWDWSMGYNPVDKDYFILPATFSSVYGSIAASFSIDSEWSAETYARTVMWGYNAATENPATRGLRINNNLDNTISTQVMTPPFSKSPTAYNKYYKSKIAVGENNNGFRGWLRNFIYIPPFTQSNGKTLIVAGQLYTALYWALASGTNATSYFVPAESL